MMITKCSFCRMGRLDSDGIYKCSNRHGICTLSETELVNMMKKIFGQEKEITFK